MIWISITDKRSIGRIKRKHWLNGGKEKNIIVNATPGGTAENISQIHVASRNLADIIDQSGLGWTRESGNACCHALYTVSLPASNTAMMLKQLFKNPRILNRRILTEKQIQNEGIFWLITR